MKLKITNLTKFYIGKHNERIFALDDLNMEIFDQEFVSIVGPSGCGKTTLLELLAGLQKPTSGQIMINGQRVNGPGLDRGIVFQEYALFPWQTIRRNVEFGPKMGGIVKKQRRSIADNLIRLVGLHGFGDHYPHELSGGMRQRAAIARALANDPDILLMDEPFAAVDAQMREILQQELLQIWEKKKKTFLFITHNIDEAIFLADKVVVMSARPGRAKHIVNVELPRPRNMEIRISEKFHEQEDSIRELVWQESSENYSKTREKTYAGFK